VILAELITPIFSYDNFHGPQFVITAIYYPSLQGSRTYEPKETYSSFPYTELECNSNQITYFKPFRILYRIRHEVDVPYTSFTGVDG
jgi:hypothetical protein